MLARRILPDEFARFNERHGAPVGRHQFLADQVARGGAPGRHLLQTAPARRWRGPFAFQWNTRTRAYEYPWVHQQLALAPGSRILEIGGALAGLQFVLDLEGHQVHNVDPFLDFGDGGYRIDPLVEHAALNRAFSTHVTLHRSTLPEADLDGRFDAVVCVSTIEHLDEAQIEATLDAARRLLVPGGLVVLTVDLFLDVVPFTDETTNRWGSNVSVAWLRKVLGDAELVAGIPEELYGLEGFSPRGILSRLEEFAMGSEYPQLAQLMSFRVAG